MQAVVLAGGKGTRLRPYTTVLPKPLMPIGDYPILEVVIRRLEKFGFDRITLAVGHQAELFAAFFGDGSKWGVSIEYSLEDRPLGTVAPLKLIDGLDDHFVLMNGDILTDLQLDELMAYHRERGGAMTIATHRRSVKIDYGTLEHDENNLLTGFREKPELHYNVSMGIYVLAKRTVDHIPAQTYFDFPALVLKLVEVGEAVVCYPYDGYWLDIGRPDDYEIAVNDFEQREGDFL